MTLEESLPGGQINHGEDLKWFLFHALKSSAKGKYNKRSWDLLQLAIDTYKVKLIINS